MDQVCAILLYGVLCLNGGVETLDFQGQHGLSASAATWSMSARFTTSEPPPGITFARACNGDACVLYRIDCASDHECDVTIDPDRRSVFHFQADDAQALKEAFASVAIARQPGGLFVPFQAFETAAH